MVEAEAEGEAGVRLTRSIFVPVDFLPEHLHCARSNFVNKIGFTGTGLLRTQYLCE